MPVRALIDCDVGFDFEGATRLAGALSAELGTFAVGLFMQTVADGYGVRAFDRGTLVRHLDYMGGEGWLRVDGAPQPWESALFFDGPADLAAEASWPDTIDDDLSEADIARYEAARAIGDARNVMDLVHASAGGIHRVAAALGVDPSQPTGRYRRSWWQRLLRR